MGSEKKLLLDDLRSSLIRQEETIIFAVIERAQFARNEKIYASGNASLVKASTASFPLVSENREKPSFLDFFFSETEKVHALVRRYTSPEEHAFFPSCLPDPVIPLLDFPEVIKPNTININTSIMTMYLNRLLPMFTEEGDDEQHGSAATCDVACLQALSKRIHYGKYVAEAKFQEDREGYTELIRNHDSDGIMARLTNKVVEERLLDRVRVKTGKYGTDIGEKGGDKVDPDVLVRMYRDFIIPMTKEVQVEYLLRRLDGPRVGYLGPKGSFSHEAAAKSVKASKSASPTKKSQADGLIPCNSFSEVMANVMNNTCLYGVLPFENSDTGRIFQVHELLLKNNVKVCGEVYVKVQHCLLSREASVKDIRVVYSHAQGFAQCRSWLQAHLPHAELITVASTAKGASMLAEGDVKPHAASISSRLAAQEYNLPILEADIHDTVGNTTRFFVVSKHIATPSGNDRTVVKFSVADSPGSLQKVLSTFTEHGINMQALQSYPDSSGAFAYGFWVELEGHQDDSNVTRALDCIVSAGNTVEVRGSFPCAHR